MPAAFAIVALVVILIVAIILFCNELFYRRRISALGVILLVCLCYLTWYLHIVNMGCLEMVQQMGGWINTRIAKGV